MIQTDKWFRLDTSGNLYPAVESLNYPGIFRFGVTLKAEINVSQLQKALNKIIKRFPTFNVKLRRGLFWFYLEPNPKLPKLKPDTGYPCNRINTKKNNDFLFQILYKKKIVSLEVFHALTDGHGAMIFFKTLVAEYLKLSGISIPPGLGIMDCSTQPNAEESENSFLRYYKGKLKRQIKEPPVFHISGTRLPQSGYKVITGKFPMSQLLEKSREQSVSITEYITAVFVYALYQLQEKQSRLLKRRAIHLSVPVNLRSYYPSKTLRNFSLFIKPGINPDLGEYTFEEVLHQIHHATRYELSEKYLSAALSANVSLEKNPAIRLVPLFLKNIMINFVFSNFGENKLSGTLSNLGRFEVPESMKEHITRFHVLLGANKINPVNCSVVSFDGYLYLTFGRTIQETELEHAVFTHFIKAGIPVTIDTET
ncbi:MAG: hypothetical protein HQ557_08775 [Bacteroidetes bacterium]|nr:hypothetical protein [Bacteroidota bacterium]